MPTLVRIGKLRSVIKIEQNVPVAMGAGFIDSYTELLTTRGLLVKQTGNRGLDNSAVSQDSRFELFVRFQVALSNALNNDSIKALRFIHNDGRVFTLVSTEYVSEDKKSFYRFILTNQK